MTIATDALPPLAPGAIPASVRGAGPQAVEQFRAALSFEEVLLGKLLSAALPEEEGGDPRAAQLPETLADAVVAAGGAGIATSLVGGGGGPAGPGAGR
jgi:hypothetical protein